MISRIRLSFCKPLVQNAVTVTSGILLFLGLASQAKAIESVTLQWNPNPEPDIAGYRLFYGPTTGNYVEEIDVGNTTSATVSNLATGGTYFFAVIAYNTLMMESLFSNEVSVTAGVGQTRSSLKNISTRLRVQSGDNVLIVGLIATGTEAKRIIIRAIGPSLSDFGVPGALADPTLELYQGNTLLFGNDDWPNSTQQGEIENSGLAPNRVAESALIWMLTPGENYTAIMRGKNGQTGVGVVEAFDLGPAANSKLGSISTRGFVDLDDNVMIAGLIVGPSTGASLNILVRALGPTLEDAGVPGTLADPTLDLVNSSGTVIRTNDNWQDSQRAEIAAAGFAPNHDEESALMETVAPGAYTAITRGNGRTTGVGLVEVYNIP